MHILRVPASMEEAAHIHEVASVPLQEAKQLLIQALHHNPEHDADCAAESFAVKNRRMPTKHPVWRSAPACHCWVGRVGAWLLMNGAGVGAAR